MKQKKLAFEETKNKTNKRLWHLHKSDITFKFGSTRTTQFKQTDSQADKKIKQRQNL